MNIFINYLSITTGIDRATTEKANFNISACSQARKKFERLRVCLTVSMVIGLLQKVQNVDTIRKSKCAFTQI